MFLTELSVALTTEIAKIKRGANNSQLLLTLVLVRFYNAPLLIALSGIQSIASGG